MFEFITYGLGDLAFSFNALAALPDEVASEMLDAGGEVIVEHHKAEITKQGLVDTGTLRDSIRAFRKLGRDRRRYVLVYPHGKHGEYNRKAVAKKYKRSKHGRTYTVGGDTKDVTNNEVGFVLEFGAPKRGISPKQWMSIANEKGIDEAVQKQEEVYDQYLKSKNL